MAFQRAWSVLIGASLLFLGGCATAPVAVTRCPHCAGADLAISAAPAPGTLVPLSDQAEWQDVDGRPQSLASLRGRPHVVVFFFTSCEIICPMTVDYLKRLESSLAAEERSRVGFVLVTMDPHHDTPECLRAYRDSHHLTGARWTLLRGTAERTAALAASLGVTFTADAARGFRHSNQITLIDGDGRLVEQQLGIQEGVGRILARLHQLAQDHPVALSKN